MSVTLQVGDVFAANKGMRVYAYIPSHFVYQNTPNNFSPARTEVKVGEIRKRDSHTLNLSYFKGHYVVEHARSEGGGTAHGPHDVYPDGWHIKARKLWDDGTYNPNGTEIEFYQSGAFTAVNKDVPVVRKMRRNVTFVAE